MKKLLVTLVVFAGIACAQESSGSSQQKAPELWREGRREGRGKGPEGWRQGPTGGVPPGIGDMESRALGDDMAGFCLGCAIGFGPACRVRALRDSLGRRGHGIQWRVARLRPGGS